MNAIFKTIWNRARAQWVVVHERTNAALQGRSAVKSKSSAVKPATKLRVAALAAAVAAAFGATPLHANVTVGGLEFTDGTPHTPVRDTSSDVLTWSASGLDNYLFQAGQYSMWRSLASGGQSGSITGTDITVVGGKAPGAFVFDKIADGEGSVATIDVEGITFVGDMGRAVNYGAYNGGTLNLNTVDWIQGGAKTGEDANLAFGIGFLSEGAGSEATVSVAGSIEGRVASGIFTAASNGGTSHLRVGGVKGGGADTGSAEEVGAGLYYGARGAGSTLYLDSSDEYGFTLLGGTGDAIRYLASDGGTTYVNQDRSDDFVMLISTEGTGYGLYVGAFGANSKLYVYNTEWEVDGGNVADNAGIGFLAADGGFAHFDGTIEATGGTSSAIYAVAFQGGEAEINLTGGNVTGSASSADGFGIAFLSHGEGSNAKVTFDGTTIQGGAGDGIQVVAYDGGYAEMTLTNGSVTSSASNAGGPGIGYLANGQGSNAKVTFDGTTIQGGAGDGIQVGAFNKGKAEMTLFGGSVAGSSSSTNSYGLLYLASGEDSTAKATFNGTTVQGNTGAGVYIGAHEKGHAEMHFIGGSLIGSTTSAVGHGLAFVAYGEGSTATITFNNTAIQGGGVNGATGLMGFADYGAEVTASGSFSATGGTVGHGDGIRNGATNGGILHYTINSGEKVGLTGGSVAQASGWRSLAGEGGTADMTVEAGGELILAGGIGEESMGMGHIATGGGIGTLTINGTLSLMPGDAANSMGLYAVANETGIGNLILNSDVSLFGGQNAASLYLVADEGGQGTITNNATMTVSGTPVMNIDGSTTIQGGTFAMAAVARGEGSVGTIINNAELILKPTQPGSETGQFYGASSSSIQYLALNGGNGVIRNADGATLEISSVGNISGAPVINSLAYSESTNSVETAGSIINEGSGSVRILGGSSEAISYLTSGSSTQASLINAGSGDFLISGGEGANNVGIKSTDDEGGATTISNTSTGNFIISGGSGEESFGMYWNGYSYGAHTISNSGEGNLIIKGGTGDSAAGIRDNGGKIENIGGGTLTIEGGSGTDAWGIWYNRSVIENSGSGLLEIVGSSAADGIGYTASNIFNSGNGTLTIRGGSKEGIYGINSLSSERGMLYGIANSKDGVLNILGEKDVGSYAIGYLASDIRAEGYIENNGTLNINKFGIENFCASNASATLTNKSTGTVNAEAEAIFETGQSEVTTEAIQISVYSADGSVRKVTTDNYATETTTSTGWQLKDDWANNSVWEDGGKLNITDMNASCDAAKEIKAAFEEKFGTGTTLNFTGTENVAGSGGQTVVGERPDFTYDHVVSMMDAGNVTDGAVILSETLVRNDVSIGDTLWIGSIKSTREEQTPTARAPERPGDGITVTGLSHSIGFKSLLGYAAVSVNSQKTFTLVGGDDLDEDIAGGAIVTLDSGNFRMGLKADGLGETMGSVTTVSMTGDSTVRAENGWFHADSVTGEGNISVDETGRFHVANAEITGKVSNAGMLSADTLTVSGTLESSKVLKSEGTISLDAGSKLSVNGIVVADSIKADGVVVKGSDAKVYQGAAAMQMLEKDHADVAADLDRLEGKAEISTMSVLDKIVEASMKKASGETASNQKEAKKTGVSVSSASSDKTSDEPKAPSLTADDVDLSSSSITEDLDLKAPQFTSYRRVAPALPQDAQAFAAFDAVNRIASDINAGGTPDGHGLWVKLLASESEYGVRAGSKYELESDGAVIGAEAKISPDLKIGAAFSYLDGEIDAGALKNDWASYGLTAYAHYRAGDFGLKGSAGWLRGTTEAVEDLDADVWHAGVRAEYDVFKGPVTVTPFMGGRLMAGSFDGMASQTVVNVPVGVKLAGELMTAGWTVTPALEASYVRSMGDTDAKDVRFLPENAFTGALSLKAEKGAWSGELSFRGSAGSNDYEDRAFTAKIGMKF